MFYLGGLGNYTQALKDIVASDYDGFVKETAPVAAE
jgi:hypothetical protein